MGNRIIDNVYILDTASGNTALPWPSKAKIMSVSFKYVGGFGEVQLSSTDTTDVVIHLIETQSGNGSVFQHLGGIDFQSMKIPILTNGTAWVYFC